MTWGLWGIGVPGPGERTAAHPSTYEADHPLGQIAANHPNVDLHAWESPQGIKVNMIQVAPEHQGKGYAGAALRDLISYADAQGLPIALTPGIPEGRRGMSQSALKRWYSSHGFVPNKGRNKDWNWAESMIRPARDHRTAHRTAAYGFQKGEMPYAGGHRAEAFDPDTGETVGYLEHDRDSGEVSSIWVHPDHRGRGIATDLFDWTRKYVNSRLRHSDDLTDEGRAWAESMGHDTGNARTVQWPTAHRTAMPWYHVSPHDLPDGTTLTPGGGRSLWDDVPYEHGGNAGSPDAPAGPRISDHVWLDNDREASDFRREQYRELHGHPVHQYEVETDHEPEDFNGEYAVPRAVIKRRVSHRADMPAQIRATVRRDRTTPRRARTMAAAVTVYTQPNCVQCTMTKKQLDKLGIAHDTVDVSADPEAHAYVTGLGYTAAPVVVVNNGEDHWAGFKPDRLKELVGGE